MQKPFRDQELLDCITNALDKDLTNRRQLKSLRANQKRVETLTAREKEVIDLVLEGKVNKVIAKELDISDRTVEIHRSHAMEKLGAKSVAELVKIMLSGENLTSANFLCPRSLNTIKLVISILYQYKNIDQDHYLGSMNCVTI